VGGLTHVTEILLLLLNLSGVPLPLLAARRIRHEMQDLTRIAGGGRVDVRPSAYIFRMRNLTVIYLMLAAAIGVLGIGAINAALALTVESYSIAVWQLAISFARVTLLNTVVAIAVGVWKRADASFEEAYSREHPPADTEGPRNGMEY
jgi:hypothetical protein